MKTKFHPCLNNDCRPKSGPSAEHVFKGIQPGEQTPFGKMADEQIWKCSWCGYEHLENIPRRRCHKRTWPYHNDSAGVTFESESHEQKYCAANKLTPDG